MKAIFWAATTLAMAMAMGSQAGAAEISDSALKTLMDCQSVQPVAARAACYDAAVATLSSAVKSGDVIVVQRKEAEAARRGAFGFNLPGLDIFDRVAGKGDGKAATPQPLDSVTTEARRAYRDGLDKWVVELVDGAVWRQIDSEVIAPAPRAGSKVEIRRAAFGSFLMKVDGQRGVRARRSQ